MQWNRKTMLTVEALILVISDVLWLNGLWLPWSSVIAEACLFFGILAVAWDLYPSSKK